MALVALSNAVRAGMASGKLGELDCSTITTLELEEAIAFTKAVVQQKEQELVEHRQRYAHRHTPRSTGVATGVGTGVGPVLATVLATGPDLTVPPPPCGTTKEVLLLLRSGELILRIRQALLSSRWSNLELAIEDTKSGFPVVAFCQQEVDHARYECENRQIFELLSKGLASGKPLAFGSPERMALAQEGVLRHNDQSLMDDAGLLDLETVAVAALDVGLDCAETFGCRTQIAHDMYHVACVVRRVRECLRHVHEYDQIGRAHV
jgi:hypothetical protein